MKNLRRLLLTAFLSLNGLVHHANAADSAANQPGAAYAFTFKNLVVEAPLPLADYQGQVILVVNTASKCGFTGQYEALQALYDKYQPRGLTIIGVPSNDFGQQEPGAPDEIATFCKLHYGVSFPMAAKEQVKGDQAHPFYQWAGRVLGFGTRPKWNFHKYLISRDGRLVDYFNSTTAPDSDRIVQAIEAELGK